MTDTPETTTEQTPPAPSAIEGLAAWKAKHGVEFLIVAVSPWGKTTPIAFLLPDGFGADIQILKAEQVQG